MSSGLPEVTRWLNDESSYQGCYVCGQRNAQGLRRHFWLDGQDIVTEFLPGLEHQGFPGVTHGGIIAALLDETLGRTGVFEGQWMMTGRIAIRFRAPAPVGQTLTIRARVVRRRRRAVEAEGEAKLPDGSIVATATGFFVALPPPVLAQALADHPDLAEYLPA
jgi:acyl-coenzyme A thioesterase PaaI-like protein